jgi:hypothetical protein
VPQPLQDSGIMLDPFCHPPSLCRPPGLNQITFCPRVNSPPSIIPLTVSLYSSFSPSFSSILSYSVSFLSSCPSSSIPPRDTLSPQKTSTYFLTLSHSPLSNNITYTDSRPPGNTSTFSTSTTPIK